MDTWFECLRHTLVTFVTFRHQYVESLSRPLSVVTSVQASTGKRRQLAEPGPLANWSLDGETGEGPSFTICIPS